MGAPGIDSILLAVKWRRLVLGDIELLQLCLRGACGGGSCGGSIDGGLELHEHLKATVD